MFSSAPIKQITGLFFNYPDKKLLWYYCSQKSAWQKDRMRELDLEVGRVWGKPELEFWVVSGVLGSSSHCPINEVETAVSCNTMHAAWISLPKSSFLSGKDISARHGQGLQWLVLPVGVLAHGRQLGVPGPFLSFPLSCTLAAGLSMVKATLSCWKPVVTLRQTLDSFHPVPTPFIVN